MRIDILTIFPEMFSSPFAESMVKRAIDKKAVAIKIHDLHNWSTDKHKSVDDRPFGGNPGMVMRVDIIDKAISELKANSQKLTAKILLLDAAGSPYTQQKALEFSKLDQIILIAGHYEGVDHRVHEHIADEVISIGPYVLSGGEIPAMVIVDSLVRLLPGVLGNPASLSEESFSSPKTQNLEPNTYTEYPQYTRPAVYKNWKVPEVLLSGNHKEIKKWQESRQKLRLSSSL